MANSCSHWWHAPFYFSMSVVLAFVIATTIHHGAHHSSLSIQTLKTDISFNASRALRTHGFNVMATLLQFSPELFLSSPGSTIFAIQDSAIANVSVRLYPWLMKQLLQYHTCPSKLTMQALLKKPQGSCLRTLINDKKIKITKNDEEQRFLEINNVLISHPDIFLEGPISVHGVVGLFSSFDLYGIHQDWDIIHADRTCDGSNQSLVSHNIEAKNSAEWSRILLWLSANGFVSFAIGLQSVLDRIVQDYAELSSFTIFAPPHFAFIALPSPLLDRIVRLHILPQRFTYRDLTLLPEKSSLRTLIPDNDLVITKNSFSQLLAINEAEITASEIFSSKTFMIHGISRALAMEEISGAFR